MIIAVSVALDPKWAPCGQCGCTDGDAGYDRWEIPGVFASRTCPRKAITSDSHEWISIYRHYKAGFLLFGGGVADQPHAFLQAMSIIDSWIKRHDNA